MIFAPRLTVSIGGVDFTDRVDNLNFSNADPGGYETMTADLRTLEGIKPGARVIVRCGLTPVFWGEVNQPGHTQSSGRDAFRLVAMGAGMPLKRTYLRQIFCDRDLSRWGPPSSQRVTNLRTATPRYVWNGESSVLADPGNNAPALQLKHSTLQSSAAGNVRDMAEAWYNAEGIVLGSIYYDQINANSSGGAVLPAVDWTVALQMSDDDIGSNNVNTGNIAGSNSSGTLVTGARAMKYARVQLYCIGTISGDGEWSCRWRKLAVYGTHGLTKRGDDPGGFYPTDIVGWVATQVPGIKVGVLVPTTFILPHSIYLDETPAEQIINDMAVVLGGWHWGVWEPSSLMADTPELHFTPVPASATVAVDRFDCPEITIPKIALDQLYDRAVVRYSDAGGAPARVTVTNDNPFTSNNGQTLIHDIGLADSSTATSFGNLALDVALLAARGSGSCELPLFVNDGSGGLRPSCTLKAGRDRLRIRSLPDVGMLIGDASRRYDTFHIRRVETTVDGQGIPRTRVDFDAGGNLIETLNARLALIPIVAGG